MSLSNEIWKLINKVPSKIKLRGDDERYVIHKARLESIIDSEYLLKNIDCIYFADYKQAIQEKSKWNWNVPLYCKGIEPYLSSISKMFLSQQERRIKGEKFSFSDFTFRDLNQKKIIRFEKSEKYTLEKKENDFRDQLNIKLPVKACINVQSENDIEWEEYNQTWKCVNLSSIIEKRADINNYAVEKEIERFCSTQNVSDFCTFISKNTDTEEIPEDEYKLVLSIMYSSLAFNDIRAFTYIPSISIKNADKEESSGGIIIPEFQDSIELSETDLEFLIILTQSWFDKNAIADFSEAAKEEVLVHARKAGISQIMARNMSHNMGSHVLSRLISEQQIKKLASFKEAYRYKIEEGLEGEDSKWAINEDFFEKYFNGEQQDISVPYEKDILKQFQYLGPHPVEIKTGDEGEDIREKAAYFNSYMKSRMDFLADIATGTPTLESSKFFYEEVIAGFDKNRILLDRISGTSDFYYRLLVHDCRKCIGGINCSEDCACSNSGIIEDDIQVSVPNDILGNHAFYVILENIIRNTAKHANKPEDNKAFEFHIEVRDYEKDNSYYEIQIYDNGKIDDQYLIESDEEKEHYELLLKGNDSDKSIKHINKIIFDQNEWLNKSILDPEKNKVRQGGWGLAEMKVSAAYLRKIPIEEIDKKEYEIDLKDIKGERYSCSDDSVEDGENKPLNILRAFKKVKNDKEYLGYRFFVMKPKEVLIVLDRQAINILEEDGIDWVEKKFELIKYGIWITYDGDKSKSKGLDLYIPGKVYAHEFLLDLTEDGCVKGLDKYSGYLPERVLTLDIIGSLKDYLKNILLKAKIEADGAKKFKEILWKDYSKNKSLNKINILDFSINEKGLEFSSTSKKKAKFLDHGSGWESVFKEFLTDKYHFVEIADSSNNILQILERASKKVSDRATGNKYEVYDKIFEYKLRESIYNKTVIIDERIQEAAFSLTYKPINGNEISFYKIYLANGIYVPSVNFLNLSKQSFDEQDSNSLEKLFSGNISVMIDKAEKKEVNLNEARFIVIHLGIIEKLLKYKGVRREKPEDEKSEIVKLIKESLGFKNSNTKFIIVSGRGKPSNLPDELPFLNFSSLAQYCIDNRSKYLMSELLFSVRRLDE